MTIQSQKPIFGQTGSMLFRKAVNPAKNGTRRMESQSILSYWLRKLQAEAAETETASDPVFAKLPLSRNSSSVPTQELRLCKSTLRKISGLKLLQIVWQD